MKRFVKAVTVVGLITSGVSFAGAACKYSDVEKLKTHLTTHVSYPATGKEVKAACKKEIPDEFPKAEVACFEAKIKDTAKFKTADEVIAAAGVK